MKHNASRIGIYSGTFDPIHAGHIAFALQALETARLDRVIFLPERRPRHKHGATHYAHRMAMVRRALVPHARLEVLETDDISFTVRRTFHRLRHRYAGAQLVFLMGSDVVPSLQRWPQIEQLLKTSELAIGLRHGVALERMLAEVAQLPREPRAVHSIESYAADISSSLVRECLYRRRYTKGLLASVAHYSNRHWLYVSAG